LLEETTDCKISLILVPQSYDYSDGEIVYRIFVDDQLISERSLPVLNEHEALCDTFIVKLDNKRHNLLIEELGYKSLILKKIIINDIVYGSLKKIHNKDFAIIIYIKKRNK
jgi:hypothetical protein